MVIVGSRGVEQVHRSGHEQRRTRGDTGNDDHGDTHREDGESQREQAQRERQDRHRGQSGRDALGDLLVRDGLARDPDALRGSESEVGVAVELGDECPDQFALNVVDVERQQ